ncbi:hypothetical protein D9611_010682 [Ephemerocybe angulata]|uniref:DUF4100 domain-containing protein n=1 Tax=Ephemerocybe angulata TaxID=980116 RepID=A0A8H5BCW0_9AGAR|nr:hypothetical protein D9611_010682 [Tulosesus angulatus]
MRVAMDNGVAIESSVHKARRTHLHAGVPPSTGSLFITKTILWHNETSSYLDLSLLSGNNPDEVKQTHDPMIIGRVLIHPDAFTDEGVALLPPASGALLTLFNPNHNYIAGQLLVQTTIPGCYGDPAGQYRAPGTAAILKPITTRLFSTTSPPKSAPTLFPLLTSFPFPGRWIGSNDVPLPPLNVDPLFDLHHIALFAAAILKRRCQITPDFHTKRADPLTVTTNWSPPRGSFPTLASPRGPTVSLDDYLQRAGRHPRQIKNNDPAHRDLDISELTPSRTPLDDTSGQHSRPATPPPSISQLAAQRAVGARAPLKPRAAFAGPAAHDESHPAFVSAYFSSSDEPSDVLKKSTSTHLDIMGDTSNSNEYVPIVPMPLRNERRAPVFNGHGAYLAQFFRDFETITRAAQLSESEWLVKILDYTRVDDYDLWSSIGATADMTWTKFKSDISKFYTGADDERRHTVSDLERLCDALSVKATVSRAEFSDFYRKFYTMVTYLENKNRISGREASRLLINAFPPVQKQAIRAQLQATTPSHHPDDPWSTKEVVAAIHIVLATSAADSYGGAHASSLLPAPAPAATHSLPLPRTTVDASPFVNQDPVAQLSNQLETVMKSFLNTVETFAVSNGGGGPRGPGGGQPRFRGCVWCAQEGHWSRECAKRNEYLNKGMIVPSRIGDGRFTYPDGSQIGRASQGTGLLDLVDQWHRQRSSPSPATGANAIPTNTVQTNIYQVVEAQHEARTTYVEDVPEDEGIQLPAATSALMERVDGEENEYLGKVDPDHLPLLEATQAALTMKIEAARRAREDGPTTRSAAKKSASRPDEVEKHPKAASLTPQAPKPSQAPSTGAIKPSAKPQETPYVHPNAAQPPQFRFAAPIEDPLHATTLAERSLDAPVSMSMRELLGVAPELRKAIKELVTAKKLPIDGGDDSRASFLTALDMPPANDLVSVLLNAFPAAAEKRVANNTESLRTISVKLDGRVPIDAILDEGSQIIGLRHREHV